MESRNKGYDDAAPGTRISFPPEHITEEAPVKVRSPPLTHASERFEEGLAAGDDAERSVHAELFADAIAASACSRAAALAAVGKDARPR